MLKTVELRIPTDDPGRDAGKVYRLTEKPASQVEKWAIRAFLALANAGVEFPEELGRLGPAGLAVLGIKGLQGVRFADAEPLLDEMMECISIQPDRSNPNIIRKPVDTDIEEVKTRLLLRQAIIELHLGFTLADVQSRLTSATTAATPSSNTKTSPG
jgi:hypothetical protein